MRMAALSVCSSWAFLRLQPTDFASKRATNGARQIGKRRVAKRTVLAGRYAALLNSTAPSGTHSARQTDLLVPRAAKRIAPGGQIKTPAFVFQVRCIC